MKYVDGVWIRSTTKTPHCDCFVNRDLAWRHVRRCSAPCEVMEVSPEGLDTVVKGGSDGKKPGEVITIKPVTETRYLRKYLET